MRTISGKRCLSAIKHGIRYAEEERAP